MFLSGARAAALGLGCLALLAPLGLWAHPGSELSLHYLSGQIAAAPAQHLYLQRASLLIEVGDFSAARADIDAAKALGDPRQVAYVQGLLLFQSGQAAAAIEQFSDYLQSHPGALPALEARARAWQQVGEAERALGDYRQFLAGSAAPAPGQYLALAALAEESNKPELALALLDQGMARLGMNINLQRAAIALALSNQQWAAAIRRQQLLGETMKHSPLWQLQLAELYVQAGHCDRAQALVQEMQAGLQRRRVTPALQRLQARGEALKSCRSRTGIPA
ncbi:MAG: hypothetical protein GYB33_05425 [Gammaproteobacteria bacterium]|nr:hypothetical protein [Gammaproteobacteria bacterium]